MPSRMDVLRDRAKPSRGSIEHQKLKADLGGIEPTPDHPLYSEFVRLTDPKPMGRPVAPEVESGERPKAGTPEYDKWWKENTGPGRATYVRQMDRQIARYHTGPTGSGARRREQYRNPEAGPDRFHELTQRAKEFYGIDDHDAAQMLAETYPHGDFPPPLTTDQYKEEGKTRWWPHESVPFAGDVRNRLKDIPVEDVHNMRLSAEIFQRAAAASWKSAAGPSKGRQDADKWLSENPEESFRPVNSEDIERLINEHVPDEWDRNFAVSTGGGGHEPQTHETYPSEGHYNRAFYPHGHAGRESYPRSPRDAPLFDRQQWDHILGQAGFEYRAHPNPTVNGFYWRPDQPSDASSLGYRIEHPSSWQPWWQAHYGEGYRDGGSPIAMSGDLGDIISHVADHNSRNHWWHTSATKRKPAKPKVRKPEEVWYDVHKHPEGVPGGMGKSPEHHLRGRGWQGHEINEGSGRKTIQYRNQKYPDFVVSYGGGSGTKPDHNFRVLYMGTNTNIPKVTRAYSVAEAMNKVEELHNLHNGLVVQPMTHGAALAQPANLIPPSRQKQPGGVIRPSKPRDMTEAEAYPDFSEQPEKSRNWWNPEHRYQLHEIPDPPPFRAKEPAKTSAFEMASREDWR